MSFDIHSMIWINDSKSYQLYLFFFNEQYLFIIKYVRDYFYPLNIRHSPTPSPFPYISTMTVQSFLQSFAPGQCVHHFAYSTCNDPQTVQCPWFQFQLSSSLFTPKISRICFPDSSGVQNRNVTPYFSCMVWQAFCSVIPLVAVG